MARHIDIIGWTHLVFAGIAALAAAAALVPAGLWVILQLLRAPNMLSSLDGLLTWLVASALITSVLVTPAVLIAAGAAVEAWVGRALLRRLPIAKTAAYVSAVALLMLGVPGIALAVATIMLVLDPEGQRLLSGEAETDPGIPMRQAA